MGNVEPDIEVLDLAIARELEAYNLYMKMSRQAQDSQMKEALESLAKEELGHKARLELELIKLGIVVRSSEYGVIGEQGEDEPDLSMDYKDVLVFAMKKERMSLRLYIDLAAMAKDKATREMLLTMAEDEAMHYGEI